MHKLSLDEIREYMETKKGVAVEKVEACIGNKSIKYLVNENYLVEYKAKSNFLPSSIGTNYKPNLTGRKISKREYNFYKDLYKNIETIN